MIWHYDCANCRTALNVDWGDREEEVVCPRCRQHHYPPTPGEDQLAYIGGDHWPPEVEEAVTVLRGTTCEVPGCFHQFETLALRKPASQGGRLSVENLIPMCHHHARLKGERDYNRWLAGLTAEERAGPGPSIKFDFTTEDLPAPTRSPAATAGDGGAPRTTAAGLPEHESAPVAAPEREASGVLGQPPSPHGQPGSSYQVLAAHTTIADKHPPEGLQFVTAAPMLAGSFRRVILHYCCALERPGACRVILAAWPRSRPPDWSRGLDGCGALVAVGQHVCPATGCADAKLELILNGANGKGLWTAAVFLGSEGGRPELTDFLLAGSS